MKIAYYPGCTLFEKAKALDQKAKKIAAFFGHELSEIPDWTCCGAVFPNSLQNLMKFAGPYRMLATTESMGDKLVTLCSACYNVMKRSNKVFLENPEIAEKLKLFTEVEYKGTVQVLHYLEFLRDTVTYDRLRSSIKPKEVKKVSPYYGCLILRPYEELGLDDPENPTLISEVINALGDQAILFPSQNECCGAYLTVPQSDESIEISKNIEKEAAAFGSSLLVTSCPLCYYNLNQANEMPVVYFTEYIASALGIE